jgi:hypothetical protein
MKMARVKRKESRQPIGDGCIAGGRFKPKPAIVLGLLTAFVLCMAFGVLAAGRPSIETQPVPPEQTEQTALQQGARTLSLDMPTTKVDFGGGYLEPGKTYQQAIAIRIRSGSDWMLVLDKTYGLVGQQTGEVIPPPETKIDATSETGSSAALSVGGSGGSQSTLVCRGVRQEGEWITVTIGYKFTVSWEIEPDNYTGVQDYSVSPI